MYKVLALVNTGILLALSVLHIYWALGGTWWKENVLPTVEHTKAFTPGVGMTMVVAIGLLVFALVHCSVWFASAWVYPWVMQSALLAIGCIFVLRAIGERNLMGFFKKVRHTKFAYYDTRIYSPLCLVIGGDALILWYFL